jgi:hypothetical protein
MMSGERPLKSDPARVPSGNDDYLWAQFDSEVYFAHNYGEPHPDDDLIIGYAVEAIARARPRSAELSIVDVGTGPNLIPFLLALPRARRLTAWEYAESNVAWLQAELRRSELRPQWRHFWDVTRKAYGPDWRLPNNPMDLLRAKCTVEHGSVYGLPERNWDAATMFFCAESITERQDEFEAACTAFARCVKRGGAVVAAFLVGCSGYEVAVRRFPVLNLHDDMITDTFSRLADNVTTRKISAGPDETIGSNDYKYSDFVFLTGTVA